MYRSLMFKSNPLVEQLHGDNGKAVRNLQAKNYSVTKISQRLGQKNKNGNFTLNPKKPNSPRYVLQGPDDRRRHNLNVRLNLRSKYNTINPEKQIINSSIQTNSSKNQPKINITNKKNIKLTDKAQESQFQDSVRIKQTRKLNISDFLNQNKSKIVETKRNKVRIQKYSIKQGDHQSCPHNGGDKDSRQKQRDNTLKSNLYHSINLNNLFQKIQFKVNNSQRSDRHQEIPSQNNEMQIIEKLRKQAKTSHRNNRTAVDQFNLSYLMDKKKNFDSYNQNTIKGNIFPGFQSLTSRVGDKSFFCQQMKQNKNSAAQTTNFNGGQMPENWMASKRKRSSQITIDDNGMVHQNHLNTDGCSQDQNNLRMSLKISNLRKMLKAQQLQFL